MHDLLHSFPGQETDEPVFIFARPYPVAFLGTALVFLIVFGFSLLGQFALMSGILADFTEDSVRIGILFLGVFQLVVLLVFLVAILDFYFDLIIVTDRRVVDINQEQLFFRSISEVSLNNVEDVHSVIVHFLPTVFNYGNVEIQSAGAKEKFVMENVHFPREIAAITINLSEQAKNKVPEAERFPETQVIAVINNRAIYSASDLQQVGAMLPQDLRLTKRNAPTPP